MRTRLILVAAVVALGLAACSGTWQGVKQDTRDNVNTVGRGVERVGERMQQ